MNILKINNGKVELRKDNGALIRIIGNGDAINADINNDGSLILITTVRGKVELRKENGSFIRSIGYHPECIRKGVLLPVLSNQKMNAYLKEVADLCGITKNLTTHCARHTFATTVTLANNISMESVSKMLGHSSLSMTKKYARILDSTIGKEMNQLAEKLQIHMN